MVKEETKEKLKKWLNNKNNLYLLGILILAFAIRLYYFILTKDQTLWWDEAEYMASAKALAFHFPWEISPQRTMLFPFLASLVYRLGLGELSIKFILVLMPSVLVVFTTYLFVKEIYNEKIALITSFITAVCWIHIFYTERVMNDELGFLFGLLAFFFFWKGYVSGKNNKLVYLSAFFIALSFLIRPTGIYYAIIIALFLFVTEQFRFLKKKQLWIMIPVFLLTLSPYLIWSQAYHGNAFAFTSAYTGPNTSIQGYGWWMLQFVYDYPELIFFIFFLAGLLTLIPLALSIDKLAKGEKNYQNDLLMLISILFILIFSIFMLRAGENRWLMIMSLGIFVLSAKGILLFMGFINKNLGKTIAVVLLVLILVLGAYFQLKHNDILIKEKLESYAPVKNAGLWIKENSNSTDKVFSRSWPQTAYYSDRETFTFDMLYTTEKNESDFTSLLLKNKPKYMVLSIFEPHSPWLIGWPQKYSYAVTPVKVYQGVISGTPQPFLVIYEMNYSELEKPRVIIK